jgi:diguanylate cyclase (GGDEF)-like protein
LEDRLTTRDPRYVQNVLLAGGAGLAFVFWLGAAWQPDASWAGSADAAHWTVVYVVAACVVWLSVGHAPQAIDRRARRVFASALSLNALGQLAYNWQLAADWNPFPAPADLLFLCLGFGYLLGFLSLMHHPGQPAVLRRVGLDVLGAATATLAVALALYQPLAHGHSPAAVAVSIAYPVALTTAAFTTLITLLHQRQRLSLAGAAISGGLLLHALAWLVWNLTLLQGPVPNGSALGLLYSVSVLLLGWGSAHLHTDVSPDPAYDRLCEAALRLLPLSLVAVASAALGWLVLSEGTQQAPRGSLLGLGVLILLLAVVRQTQQLGERDRLLDAERAVAEGRAQLQHQAQHDALTGLPNLLLLRDRAERAIAQARRQGQRVALLFIDLDQFKEVNDTLGHAAGDALLKYLAAELKTLLREADTVARQGGDEFCIVLPGVQHPAEVTVVAEKVMALSRHSVVVDGHELPLHMSVGIALYPDNAADFDSLMQAADTAMYRAKSAGRKGYRFYDAAMNTEALVRLQLRTGLAQALRRQELSLVYQPQVDLRSGATVGVEALLRWHSAELGEVSPARFIPVAEDSGLIVDIGGWVLHEACRQAMAWRAQGLPPVRMAVNISVLQFRRGNLEQQVMQALADTGLEPAGLELELTESVLMQEHDKVLHTLDRLAALGVGLAIDDFGTGYSSLSYLQRLRVRTLKIDRSFVSQAEASPSALAIVRAVVQMADAVGLHTLAEGVETPAQRQLLIECGCTGGQGYWFAKPMPAADLALHLVAQREGETVTPGALLSATPAGATA